MNMPLCSACKSICKASASRYATHAMKQVKSVFMREAKHTSDTHITSSFNWKLQEL